MRREGLRDPAFWLLTAVTLFVVGAAWLPRTWMGGHEPWAYLFRASEFHGQIAGGELRPRWCPNFYWGYGYPLFVFYPPGFFYGSSLFQGLGFSVFSALKLVNLVGCAVGFVGLWRLARMVASDGAARVAAVLGTLATYRFVDLYVRGDFAEGLAMALLPWVLAGVIEVARGVSGGWWRLGFAVAGAMWIHTITGFLACLVLLFSGLGLAARGRIRAFVQVGLAGAFGLVLSASYWLPAMAMRPLVQTEKMTGLGDGGYSFHWSVHFVALRQRFEQGFGFGSSMPELADGMSFGSSPLLLAAVVAGLVLLRRRELRAVVGPLLLGLLATNVAMLAVSTPVWKHAPLLSFFQFPWRLLGLDLVLAAVLAAVVFDAVERPTRGQLLGGAALVAAGLVWQSAAVFDGENVLWLAQWLGNSARKGVGPVAFLLVAAGGAAGAGLLSGTWRSRVAAMLVLTGLPLGLLMVVRSAEAPTPLPPEVIAAAQDPAAIAEWDRDAPAGVATPINTAGVDEYLPRTVPVAPAVHPDSPEAWRVAGDLGAPTQERGARRTWVASGPAVAPWFHFDGVRASVDGVEVEAGVDPRGLVRVDGPASEHRVEVWYSPSPLQRLASAVSLVGLLLLLGLELARRRARGAGATDP